MEHKQSVFKNDHGVKPIPHLLQDVLNEMNDFFSIHPVTYFLVNPPIVWLYISCQVKIEL